MAKDRIEEYDPRAWIAPIHETEAYGVYDKENKYLGEYSKTPRIGHAIRVKGKTLHVIGITDKPRRITVR